MENYEEQLLSILNTVSFKEENKGFFLSINDKKVGIDFSEPDLLSDSSIIELKEEIYKQYHFTNENNPGNSEEIESIQFFRQKIQEDRYWAIDATENNGTVVARKNSERARIPVGSFYGVGNFSVSKQAGQRNPSQNENFVHIITSRKILSEGEEKILQNQKKIEEDSFIFLFGKNILRDEFGEDTIRFYFNFVPNKKKIKKWIHLLSSKLDKREIPYSLKYLTDIKFYKRTDSGVLYIHKQNFSIVAQIVREIYKKIDGLGKIQPLFTKRLADGLGFAENPLEKEESFGTQKSFQILRCIIAYIKAQTSPFEFKAEGCLNFIKGENRTNKVFFELKTPYLTKNSSYFYDFNIFDKNANIKIVKYRKTKNRYLNAAQHFAKLIESKAIWLNTNERTWVTYTEKNKSTDEDNMKGFRPVNDKEKLGIELFLDSLNKWLDPFIQEKSHPEIEVNLSETINNFIFNTEPIEGFKPIEDNAKAKKVGDKILQRFVKIGLPVLNRFENFEFCPTITHGLAFYGYLFLRLSNPKYVPKLDRSLLDDF